MDRWGCYESKHTYADVLSCLIRPPVRSSLVPPLEKTCITKLHILYCSECHRSEVNNKEILSRGISLLVLNCTKQSDSSIFTHETHARQQFLLANCENLQVKTEQRWTRMNRANFHRDWHKCDFTLAAATKRREWRRCQSITVSHSLCTPAQSWEEVESGKWKHLCGCIVTVKGASKEKNPPKSLVIVSCDSSSFNTTSCYFSCASLTFTVAPDLAIPHLPTNCFSVYFRPRLISSSVTCLHTCSPLLISPGTYTPQAKKAQLIRTRHVSVLWSIEASVRWDICISFFLTMTYPLCDCWGSEQSLQNCIVFSVLHQGQTWCWHFTVFEEISVKPLLQLHCNYFDYRSCCLHLASQ